MSVVVKIEMPKDCQYCPMAHWDLRNILSGCDAVPGKRYLQGKDDEFWKDGRPSWCPIVCEIPEEHGDLVDWVEVTHGLNTAFTRILDDEVLHGTKLVEYPAALIEKPIMVKIIVPAERIET